MSDIIENNDNLNEIDSVPSSPSMSELSPTERKTVLSGMFREWYLEYASYVILERAVPDIEDGLKPVQRRILHSMRTIDDGRFNKVANIVGNTMQFHPHGDQSITGALVQLGQKDLLIDTQGNWGNIHTGDDAAASRYIEARLSEFAIESVFSPKITEWTPSYDGRNEEPVTLPVKFPLLLAQGAEGIAVGLSSKILPHNFNDIIDASINALYDRPFRLLPDFQTGGLLDVSKYNDGARGGSVKSRAKIEKLDNKTLAITELPFGVTTTSLIASILSAVDKGKIKIKSIEDNTSAQAEILVNLNPGTSSDKTIDALYAFTSCEISISPNCCVIRNKKPEFLSVSDVIRHSVEKTKNIFKKELEIKFNETSNQRLFASLEKIFIENRLYKDKEIENAPDMESALRRLDLLLEPFKPLFFRPLTDDDLNHLWEIKMGRILKFNSEKTDKKIADLEKEIEEIEYNLQHLTEYTEKWYLHLKEKYGDKYPRRTVIRGFDSIEATKVAEANKRFYHDEDGGFIGTALKDKKFLFTCSDLDDILIIYRTGKYKIVKVQEKIFIDKNVKYIGVFKKNDRRTIYNVIYRNGKGGSSYMKRFFITGLTRDKEYDITKGLPGSLICWLTCNPNGEAETVKISLKDEPDASGRKPRNLELFVNFSDLAVKGKESLGNLVTKYQIKNKGITLEKKGASTLGGREVWFDADVLRLNYDGRGRSLGTFQGDDQVLVITRNGEFYTTSYSDTNHYDDNIERIEKFDPHKIWTLILNDATQGFPYIKRFTFESSSKPQRFVGTDENSSIILLTDTPFARINVTFGGADAVRPALEIDTDEFIGLKSFKAKGKRLSAYNIDSVTEIEPLKFLEEISTSDETEEAESDEKSHEEVQDNYSSDDIPPLESKEPSLFDLDSI